MECHETPIELLCLTIEASVGGGYTVKAIHLHVNELKPGCPREIQHELTPEEMIDYVECLLVAYQPMDRIHGLPQRLPFS
jgi:hypothetical protein